jgi:phosphoserine phosphatase RsbU/P
MPSSDPSGADQFRLEVRAPDGKRSYVQLSDLPFLIGRGGDTGNHLQLSDRRISRSCCAVTLEGKEWYVEDRGHHRGIFLNGNRVQRSRMQLGDVLTFGFDDSYQIVLRSAADEESVERLLTRIGQMSAEDTSGGLQKLNLLLEATSLLHSELPLDSVLGAMLGHAISITGADRGVLLEPEVSGTLRPRLAQSKQGTPLSPESLTASQTALRQAIEQKSAVITEDLNRAEMALQQAQSIVAQSLRAVVVIPLYVTVRGGSNAGQHGGLLGLIYLDSRRPTAFSKLDREILDALAGEAASVLDNARLVERERQRQRFEQELKIARDIQQGLIPHGFREFDYLAVAGIHTPCHDVGGDYFDVFPLDGRRTAIMVADVSGKGLGAALLTTMLQGALSGMTIGTDPVRVITHINRFLCDHAEVGRYATMFFGTIDANGKLEYINAGHPSPLVIRRGAIVALTNDGSFPVGLIPEADYVAKTATLEPSDTLVLFSDGVTEAMNVADEMFGTARLRQVLSDKYEIPLQQLQETVLGSVREFTHGANQADDITLLIVRYRGTAPEASMS